jgi:hypothetical protein
LKPIRRRRSVDFPQGDVVEDQWAVVNVSEREVTGFDFAGQLAGRRADLADFRLLLQNRFELLVQRHDGPGGGDRSGELDHRGEHDHDADVEGKKIGYR